jgi:hypothetical protein
MPGVPMVIGNHNHTIFLRRTSQICTELDTKEKTVSRLVRRIPQNLGARLKQDSFQAGVGQGAPLPSGAWLDQESNLACDLS